MLGDACDIKLAIGQVIADVLACITHAVIQRRIKRFVNRLHPAQQHLLKQVNRQQFGVATTGLSRLDNLRKKLAKLRQMNLIRAIKTGMRKNTLSSAICMGSERFQV